MRPFPFVPLPVRSIGLLLLTVLLAAGCSKPAPNETRAGTPAAAPMTSGPPPAGPVKASWVKRRVADAKRRLTASPAGTLVWSAIEAHGGLHRWLSFGTVAFDFDYTPLAAPDHRMYTHNRVDLWRARAVQHELGDGADATLGWNGAQAFIEPSPRAFPSPAQFWATTPYYFVGIPFVFGDPGTRFARMADATLDGKPCNLVKVTFAPGTGDSPDDYYVLYIDPATHRIGAIRYVISWHGFYPHGGHSPERLMRYTDERSVQGLWIAHSMDAYAWDAAAGQPGDRVTTIRVSHVHFGDSWSGTIFGHAGIAPHHAAK